MVCIDFNYTIIGIEAIKMTILGQHYLETSFPDPWAGGGTRYPGLYKCQSKQVTGDSLSRQSIDLRSTCCLSRNLWVLSYWKGFVTFWIIYIIVIIRIALCLQALKLPVEDPEFYREKAETLSQKFGDKFEEGYKTKLQEILYGE